MKFGQKIAVAGFITTSLLLLSIAGYGSFFAVKKESKKSFLFNVPEGATLRSIAYSLEGQGVINNGTLFIVLGKFMLTEKDLKAGEYLISEDMNSFNILSAFRYGLVNYHKVTIPVGYNIEQIGQIFDSKGLVDADTFRDLTRDTELIDLLNIDVVNLEGFLYPDTYYFSKGGDPKRKVRKMVLRFKEVFDEGLKERALDLNMTIKDIVTLASLVEKEAGREEEYPIISAVFHNRLKDNMRLQSDPTVIYALGDK